jgi:glycosyltransferase involved in cell wall biosynthesis
LLTQRDADSWAGLTKTYVIPNSIPFYPSCSSSCDNKVVIFVGRFNEQKGLEYLIKTWESTFKKHRDWTLHIYGDGDQKEMLYQLISKAGLEKGVKVHQPTKKIMEKYLESSIFLLTSRFEGLPMVIVEAMACGLPVVSFDCPYGPADIIQNGEDGYLVEYLNTDEAALKVCELIENPELRKQMSRNARENIKRFDRNVIMKKWVDLFEILCNEKKH